MPAPRRACDRHVAQLLEHLLREHARGAPACDDGAQLYVSMRAA